MTCLFRAQTILRSDTTQITCCNTGYGWESRLVRCCLKQMNSCATAPGEHFPSMADHPPLLASSSLGFGSVLQSHFSAHKLERFMRVRLALRRLHLRYLHYPLARLSQLGNSWRLRGLLRFFVRWLFVW